MPPSKFEELAAALAGEHQRRQPVELWIEEHAQDGFFINFGATYDDSRGRVLLGRLDKSRYRGQVEWQDALLGAYLKCGIDAAKLAPNLFTARDEQWTEAKQRFAEALLNSGYFAGAFRSYSADFATPGSAFGDAFEYQRGPRQSDMFRRPAPREETPEEIERKKAVERCRDLKRLRDSTTYDGEKRNAQAAMDRLQVKHGIKDREI